MKTINVKEETKDRFLDYVKSLVMARNGAVVSQDEALRELLAKVQKQKGEQK